MKIKNSKITADTTRKSLNNMATTLHDHSETYPNFIELFH